MRQFIRSKRFCFLFLVIEVIDLLTWTTFSDSSINESLNSSNDYIYKYEYDIDNETIESLPEDKRQVEENDLHDLNERIALLDPGISDDIENTLLERKRESPQGTPATGNETNQGNGDLNSNSIADLEDPEMDDTGNSDVQNVESDPEVPEEESLDETPTTDESDESVILPPRRRGPPTSLSNYDESDYKGGEGNGEDNGESNGEGYGEGNGDSYGEGNGNSYGESNGDSYGEGYGDSYGGGYGDSYGGGYSDTYGGGYGDSYGGGYGDSYGDSYGGGYGDSYGGGYGDSYGEGYGDYGSYSYDSKKPGGPPKKKTKASKPIPKQKITTTSTTMKPVIPASELDYAVVLKPFEESELKARQAENVKDFDKKDFFLDCQDVKKCFGHPENCTVKRACEAAVSFRPVAGSDAIQIELLGKTPKYIALGFSEDQKMGNDNVVECVREKDQIRVYRSFNQRFQRDNKRLKDHSALSNMKGYFANEWLYCSFEFKKKTSVRVVDGSKVKTLTFDFDKKKYFLLLARGNSVEYRENKYGIGYHDLGTAISREKYNLMNEEETRGERVMEKLHGILIVVGWMFVLPVSTFIIRYFKNACVEKYIGNFSVWFAAHIILNGVVVGLTVGAVILIFVSRRRKLSGHEWHFHNVAAIFFSLLVMIQIGLGVAIYRKRHKTKKLISCLHAFLGHVTFFLAYSMIYKSKNIRHGLPCSTEPVFITWIVLYFVVHIIISYQVCYVDFIHGVDASRVYNLGGLAPAPATTVETEPPGRLIRNVLLGVMIVLGAVVTIIIVVMYAMGYPDCVRQAENEQE